MQITYTAPNRSHHYPYVEALHRSGHLHAFISGFSRFSPRAGMPSVGKKINRHDFFQNLYLASLKFNLPEFVTARFNHLTNLRLDLASYGKAKESDVFIYYRTQGLKSSARLRKEKYETICVMEEVNSHIDVCFSLMQEEYERLGLGKYPEKFTDHQLRLRAYDEADYILCPSEFVRRSFLSKGFSADRLIKVNFGFSPVNIGVKHPDNEKDIFRVLYVGQIHYRKGLRYAIEAFQKLKHPKKEFVIVGPRTNITGLENISLPKEVVFTGVLKGEALNEQYRLASVFILPSLEEGLALVQGEALSFGIPLLITTNTGGEDLITNGKEGFIVPAGNATALAEKLQEMADDRDLLSEMSASALTTAQRLGDWDNAAHKLVTELTRILKEKKGK